MEPTCLISRLLLLVVFSAVLTTLRPAYAYPTGAPDIPSVCDQLMPSHAANTPQTTPSPYRLTISNTSYGPNTTINVIIQGGNFEGFILEAQQSGNSKIRIGSFRTTGVVQLTCNSAGGGSDRSAVTHTGIGTKNDLLIVWTAPRTGSGDIIFKATVVQSFTTFWVGVQSAIVTGPQESAPDPGSDVDTTTCATQKSCYRVPVGCTTSNCAYLLTWTKTSSGIAYELSAAASSSASYVAMGLSKDNKMGDDSVTSCIFNDATSNVDIKMFWNVGKSPTPLANDSIGLVPGTSSGAYSNGRLFCRFTRVKDAPQATTRRRRQSTTSTSAYYPGTESYYALIAKGPAVAGLMGYHTTTKLASDSPINFNADSFSDTAGAQTGLSSLVKAHGILMIIAWMVLASFGVLLPRYYKETWSGSKWCGKAIWFQLHQPIMICVLILTAIAFIIIFAKAQTYRQLPAPTNAHGPLGIIVMILVILNPVMAAFRCDPSSRRRPFFNVFHSIVGFLAHVASAAVILLGMYMQEASLPDWCRWVVVAWICWQILVEIILTVWQAYLKFRQSDPPTGKTGHTFNVEPTRNEKSGTKADSVFKAIISVVHPCVVIGFAVAVCVQIGMM